MAYQLDRKSLTLMSLKNFQFLVAMVKIYFVSSLGYYKAFLIVFYTTIPTGYYILYMSQVIFAVVDT